MLCTIRDSRGKPVSNVKTAIRETDSVGHYEVQYAGREGPEGRCVMESDQDGN